MIKYKIRKGSSTILVILLVFSMVIFGVLAMMSSYSGLKLARKNALWTKEYYELESKAEMLLFDINLIIEQSIVNSKGNSKSYWENLNKSLEKLNNNNVKIIFNYDEIIISAEYNNNKTDKFIALFNLKNPGNQTINNFNIPSQYTKLIIVERWQLVPRNVEFEDLIEFKDLEVNDIND